MPGEMNRMNIFWDEDEIIEVGVYERPTSLECDTTIALSDTDCESDDISIIAPGSNKISCRVSSGSCGESESGDSPDIICVEDASQGAHRQCSTIRSVEAMPLLDLVSRPPSNTTATSPSAVVHNRLKLVSWNIDGLNDLHLAARMTSICRIIRNLNVDIVFLQEVIPPLIDLISQNFVDYEVINGNSEGYFTTTLLRKCSVHYVSHSVLEFSSTKMERNLTCTQVNFNNHAMLLMNTHLESMGYSSEVRKTQLKKCFRHCVRQPQASSVIFGGDTNLRDHEIQSIGGLPTGIEDIWETCGRSPASSYTWDMTLNDNLDWAHGATRPRCRFDRIYLRQSQPPYLKPATFNLIGQNRMEVLRCFPSDHWGLLCEFSVMQAP
ncbi:tyrosyl-DNA phosphodiesterase 2-like [Ornithodoros turicata]|uniref:tyrosyl-DNA phosphodiesterase 2-like n=1 Tax=Ornithodoros turicata TaxID=34597 RepID=UPI00313933C8